jgi:hypothetical protein
MSRAFIPYGQHVSDDIDIAAIEIRRGDWLTTRLLVGRFKAAFKAHMVALKRFLETG